MRLRASILSLPFLALAACTPALHKAAHRGDSAEVRRLLDAGADPNEIDTYEFFFPLSAAKTPEIVDMLVAKGADLHHPWKGGPVMAALALQNWSGARRMVELGAAVPSNWASLSASAPAELRRLLAEKSSPAGAAPSAPAPTESSSARPSPAASVQPAKRRSDVDEPGYSSAKRPEDFAVVIGVESYAKLPKASYALNDAQTVRRHLLALGLPERNIILLTEQNATRSKLSAYFDEWLPRNVGPDSRLFVYYSGHGAPDPKNGQAYLIPWDGDPAFLKSTAYPLASLYEQLAKLPAKSVVVALDACFSGAGGRSVLAAGARPLVTKTESPQPHSKLTVLAAASADEITGALDDQGHGLFTYYLLQGLGAGKRSAAALLDYLKPLVQDEARRQNREQTPVLLGLDAPL